MIKQKDLMKVRKDKDTVSFRSPAGEFFVYDRTLGRVGWQRVDFKFDWYYLDKNDLTTAKRKIVQLHNEDIF